MIPTFSAHNGFAVPQIGLGTYQFNGFDGVKAMVGGARNGYRLFDSAFNYENEGALGAAVAQIVFEGIATREELIIASKLPGRRHSYDQAIDTIEESLLRASLEYFDLYLIHWPNPLEDKYVEAWTALIEAQKRGYIKQIGVCNFLPPHLDRLKAETGIMPVINQIELHPYFSQSDQREYHREHGIITQAWSPLGRGTAVLTERVLQEIAAAHQRSVAQIVLRWQTQIGAMPIPKSSSPQRQVDNLNIFDFELTDAQLDRIDALSRPDGRRKDQDPAVYQEF